MQYFNTRRNRFRGFLLVAFALLGSRVLVERLDALAEEATTSRSSNSGQRPSGDAARSPENWPLLYLPIEDADAHSFVETALSIGREWLGPPHFPVRTVQLRLSFPKDSGRGDLRSGFRLTELNDPEKGVFTIYLSARPGEVAFYGQLAHEILHVFEPRCRDIYVEGLNTLLARKLLRHLGLPWKQWEEHFKKGKDPLYGTSYALMEELERIVGEKRLCSLVKYTRPATYPILKGNLQTGNKERPAGSLLRIDIEGWLESLDLEPREAARKAILGSFSRIESLRLKTHRSYGFERPRPPRAPTVK